MKTMDFIIDFLSSAITNFKMFIVARLGLNMLTFVIKYTPNGTMSDTNEFVSTFNSIITEGLGMVLNTANPIPLTLIMFNSPFFKFDIWAGIILIIAIGIAYMQRRMSEFDSYHYNY
jgi:hypothetical protein